MNKSSRLSVPELSDAVDKRFGRLGEEGVMWLRDGVEVWRCLAEGTERGIARAAGCHPNSVPRGMVPRSKEAVDFVFAWTRDHFKPISLRAKPGVAVQRYGLKAGEAWKLADPWSYHNCPPWYIAALDAALFWRWNVMTGQGRPTAFAVPDGVVIPECGFHVKDWSPRMGSIPEGWRLADFRGRKVVTNIPREILNTLPERATAENYVAVTVGLTSAALRAKLAEAPAPLREFFEATLADGKLTDEEGLERVKDGTQADCGRKTAPAQDYGDTLAELDESDLVVLKAEAPATKAEVGAMNRPGSIERVEFFVPIGELRKTIWELADGERVRPDIVWPSDAASKGTPTDREFRVPAYLPPFDPWAPGEHGRAVHVTLPAVPKRKRACAVPLEPVFWPDRIKAICCPYLCG